MIYSQETRISFNRENARLSGVLNEINLESRPKLATLLSELKNIFYYCYSYSKSCYNEPEKEFCLFLCFFSADYAIDCTIDGQEEGEKTVQLQNLVLMQYPYKIKKRNR